MPCTKESSRLHKKSHPKQSFVLLQHYHSLHKFNHKNPLSGVSVSPPVPESALVAIVSSVQSFYDTGFHLVPVID
jgi:hypothetical protein